MDRYQIGIDVGGTFTDVVVTGGGRPTFLKVPTRSAAQAEGVREGLEQAAARLRHTAITAAYAGLEHKHLAFALALVLDELRLHLLDLQLDVRAQRMASCRQILSRQQPDDAGRVLRAGDAEERRRRQVVAGDRHTVLRTQDRTLRASYLSIHFRY